MLKIRQSGYILRFYRSNLSEQLWIDPRMREQALEFFHLYVTEGDCILDVGANVGDTALVCALEAGPSGKVWAIEPHPTTFQYLRGNIELNGIRNICAVNVAAGGSAGTISFGNDRRDDMNRVGESGISVTMKRIDDIVPADCTFALLKIDIEGYELHALAGARRVLEQTRCIYFEVSQLLCKGFGYQISDLLRFLEQEGFAIFRQSSPNSVERISTSFNTAEVENLIGVRDPCELAERTAWQLS